MVKVAVAGGTGSVGKTIVDAIVAAGEHDVIVLTRKPSKEKTQSAPEFLVDYADIAQVTQVLENERVHTVISTIAVMDEITGASERGLVAAAEAAVCTRRFVASNWGGITPSDETLRIPFQVSRMKTIEALKRTNLEWTTFQNGYFLDYYGMPYIRTNLKPLAFVLDIANGAASIPGSGDDVMTFTYTGDLGRFVNASLGLREGEWGRVTVCWSVKTSWNRMLAVAEGVRGAKFKVAYDSVEKLKRGEITELPFHRTLYDRVPKEVIQGIQSKFGLYVVYGLFDLPDEGSLNERFPEIRTMGVEDVVGLWRGH